MTSGHFLLREMYGEWLILIWDVLLFKKDDIMTICIAYCLSSWVLSSALLGIGLVRYHQCPVLLEHLAPLSDVPFPISWRLEACFENESLWGFLMRVLILQDARWSSSFHSYQRGRRRDVWWQIATHLHLVVLIRILPMPPAPKMNYLIWWPAQCVKKNRLFELFGWDWSSLFKILVAAREMDFGM